MERNRRPRQVWDPDKMTEHHLLFPRQEWDLRKQGREIRATRSMRPMMTAENHKTLHSIVPLVPALGYHTLFAVEQLWTPRRDTIRDIDSLCLAMDRATNTSRAHPIERDLAGLAIEALMLEKQVLKDVGFEAQ